MKLGKIKEATSVQGLYNWLSLPSNRGLQRGARQAAMYAVKAIVATEAYNVTPQTKLSPRALLLIVRKLQQMNFAPESIAEPPEWIKADTTKAPIIDAIAFIYDLVDIDEFTEFVLKEVALLTTSAKKLLFDKIAKARRNDKKLSGVLSSIWFDFYHVRRGKGKQIYDFLTILKF